MLRFAGAAILQGSSAFRRFTGVGLAAAEAEMLFKFPGG
jgi:hypothetical protein